MGASGRLGRKGAQMSTRAPFSKIFTCAKTASMDSAAKYKLIEKTVQLEDDALLEEVSALLESRRPDYQLSESHKQLLEGRLAEDDAQPGASDD